MSLLELTGRNVQVALDEDLHLIVRQRDGRPLWESSRSLLPAATVRSADGEPRPVRLQTGEISISPVEEGAYRGRIVRLTEIEGTDLVLDLLLALDADADELLIQIGQAGGSDSLVRVDHLYRFEKAVADGGYMLLPHGSGYLIPADCPDPLPGEGEVGGIVGARWSLPLFGMVRGSDALCIIAESWWDCDVAADHVPDDCSALDFSWVPSLGEFAYPRRQTIRFAENMDHVGMAQHYRERAQRDGLLRSLEEKAEVTPAIRHYVENVLFRWPAWNPDEAPSVLGDIHRLRAAGLGVNFFYPKWSSAGYSPEQGTATTANAGWQAFLHPTPVPGGWQTLVDLEHQVHDLGCLVQGFVCPIAQEPEGVQFDADRWPVDAEGNRRQGCLSSFDALERMNRVFDGLERAGLQLDLLYYDGFSAHLDIPEDFSADHPISRRQNIEAENACFAETRRRGIVPGAELARFWAMGDCDFFFFTDWSADRLFNKPNQHAPAPVGEPIPLFPLVFHDCYAAGFSGGGYVAYAPGYDWWDDRTPRLYELMYGAAPAYNWLPGHEVPICDWDSGRARSKRAWLLQWSAFYRAVALSAMTAHRFLSSDRSLQRVEFANGAAAEFDMARNSFRVEGIEGFTGDWEPSPEL